MSVVLSHGGPNISRSNGADPRLLVATLDGLAFLERSGVNWSVASRRLDGLHVSALMIEPSRGRIFAGTHHGGLFASDDDGKSWQRKDTGIVSDNFYALNCVETPQGIRLYAGTEPAHLYVSHDLGESWQELSALRDVPGADNWSFPGPPHVAHVKCINFDPRSPDTVYVAIEVGGLLKSTDSGKSWTELSGFYEDVHRVVLSPQHPEHVYIATGDGIYRSTDGGGAWQRLTDQQDRIAYPDALILHPEQDGLAYTAGAIRGPGAWRTTHDADARVGRSRDHGNAWEILGNGLPDHIRGNIEAMSMNLWPGSFNLFAGTTDGDIFASDDGGDTWDTIVSGLAPISKGGHYLNLRVPEEIELAAPR